MVKLPDFDTMMQLHKDATEALERHHQGWISKLVSNESKDTKRRLQGLQFMIEMELRRAKNPTARFLKIFGITQEEFTELNYCLTNPLEAVVETHKADIVKLYGNPYQPSHPSKN